MGKTITIRVDDTTYSRIKSAAESEKRTISNFMEYATLAYLDNSVFVTDEEMQQTLENPQLIDRLRESIADVHEGNYRIVE